MIFGFPVARALGRSYGGEVRAVVIAWLTAASLALAAPARAPALGPRPEASVDAETLVAAAPGRIEPRNFAGRPVREGSAPPPHTAWLPRALALGAPPPTLSAPPAAPPRAAAAQTERHGSSPRGPPVQS